MAITRPALCAGALIVGCGSAQNGVTPGEPSGSGSSAAASCLSNAPLSGAAYDITKSHFAFGSTPSKQVTGSLVHTSMGSSSPFYAAVTYDLVETAPPSDSGGLSLGGEEDLSFDPNGNPVTIAW